MGSGPHDEGPLIEIINALKLQNISIKYYISIHARLQHNFLNRDSLGFLPEKKILHFKRNIEIEKKKNVTCTFQRKTVLANELEIVTSAIHARCKNIAKIYSCGEKLK